MVDTRTPTCTETPRDSRAKVGALLEYLDLLTRHPNDALAEAALVVQRYVEARPELLTARAFHEVYLEILRQGGALAYQHRAREWRAVRGLAVGVYHSLLREFRNELKRQHGESRRTAQRARAGIAAAAGGRQ